MLENLLQQYDNLGRPDQLFEIVSLAELADSIPRSDLTNIGIPIGAIDLLCAVSILEPKGERVRLIYKSDSSEIFVLHLIKNLFNNLKKAGLLHQFISHENLFFDASKTRISVQKNKIPLRFSNLRNLLVAFKFFVPDEIIKFEFFIHPDYQDWFINAAVPHIIPYIEGAQLRDNPLENLLAQKSRQEALGKEAEEFALVYEKRQRAKHPKVENIQIISEIDTHAGFDILSYSSDNALVLDKFIEVKSYSRTPQFYWSANEVRVAREKKEAYYLYLVDREMMVDPEYRPIQIQNPSKAMFTSKDWEYREDGFYFMKS